MLGDTESVTASASVSDDTRALASSSTDEARGVQATLTRRTPSMRRSRSVVVQSEDIYPISKFFESGGREYSDYVKFVTNLKHLTRQSGGVSTQRPQRTQPSVQPELASGNQQQSSDDKRARNDQLPVGVQQQRRRGDWKLLREMLQERTDDCVDRYGRRRKTSRRRLAEPKTKQDTYAAHNQLLREFLIKREHQEHEHCRLIVLEQQRLTQQHESVTSLTTGDTVDSRRQHGDCPSIHVTSAQTGRNSEPVAFEPVELSGVQHRGVGPVTSCSRAELTISETLAGHGAFFESSRDSGTEKREVPGWYRAASCESTGSASRHNSDQTTNLIFALSPDRSRSIDCDAANHCLNEGVDVVSSQPATAGRSSALYRADETLIETSPISQVELSYKGSSDLNAASWFQQVNETLLKITSASSTHALKCEQPLGRPTDTFSAQPTVDNIPESEENYRGSTLTRLPSYNEFTNGFVHRLPLMHRKRNRISCDEVIDLTTCPSNSMPTDHHVGQCNQNWPVSSTHAVCPAGMQLFCDNFDVKPEFINYNASQLVNVSNKPAVYDVMLSSSANADACHGPKTVELSKTVNRADQLNNVNFQRDVIVQHTHCPSHWLQHAASSAASAIGELELPLRSNSSSRSMDQCLNLTQHEHDMSASTQTHDQHTPIGVIHVTPLVEDSVSSLDSPCYHRTPDLLSNVSKSILRPTCQSDAVHDAGITDLTVSRKRKISPVSEHLRMPATGTSERNIDNVQLHCTSISGGEITHKVAPIQQTALNYCTDRHSAASLHRSNQCPSSHTARNNNVNATDNTADSNFRLSDSSRCCFDDTCMADATDNCTVSRRPTAAGGSSSYDDRRLQSSAETLITSSMSTVPVQSLQSVQSSRPVWEITPRLSRHDINSWDAHKVAHWIQSVPGCGEYAMAFRREEVDGAALLQLSDTHLLHVIKMKLGPAMRLRAALRDVTDDNRL